jgi:hypothetical protein
MGYIDPGIFGMISQIGYVLFFSLVSALLILWRPIKRAFVRLKHTRQTHGDQPVDPGLQPAASAPDQSTTLERIRPE